MPSRSHQERLSPKIVEEIRSFRAWIRGKSESDNFEPGRTLYHYTDLDAVEHMLSCRQFRLSGLSKVRQADRAEIEYGIGILRGGLEDRDKGAPPEMRFLIRILLAMFNFEQFTEKFDCYIGCFTRHAEDRDMWSTFGREGSGAALGFSKEFFAIRPAVPEVLDMVMQPVLYGPEDPLHRLNKLLAEVGPRLKRAIDFLRSQPPGPRRERNQRELYSEFSMQVLGGFLIPISLITKEPRFRGEAEIRGVAMRGAWERKGEPRPDYHHVDLKLEEIAETYFGPACNQAQLREIWSKYSLEGSLLRAARYA